MIYVITSHLEMLYSKEMERGQAGNESEETALLGRGDLCRQRAF